MKAPTLRKLIATRSEADQAALQACLDKALDAAGAAENEAGGKTETETPAVSAASAATAAEEGPEKASGAKVAAAAPKRKIPAKVHSSRWDPDRKGTSANLALMCIAFPWLGWGWGWVAQPAGPGAQAPSESTAVGPPLTTNNGKAARIKDLKNHKVRWRSCALEHGCILGVAGRVLISTHGWRAVKAMKWIFDVPREEHVKQLSDYIKPSVGKSLFKLLFSTEFKHHSEALDILIEVRQLAPARPGPARCGSQPWHRQPPRAIRGPHFTLRKPAASWTSYCNG